MTWHIVAPCPQLGVIDFPLSAIILGAYNYIDNHPQEGVTGESAMKHKVYNHSFEGVVHAGWAKLTLVLGMLSLATVLFSGSAIYAASANNVQKDVADNGQVQASYVPEEQENAYRAAKRETDPRIRAEKLYEFVQKYPKSALTQHADLEEIKPIEDEYNAYYAATQEPDYEKRADLLIRFLQKFSQSALKGNIENEYVKMLKDSAQGKKFELLESLAEKWLQVRPGDKQAYAFMAEARLNLQKYQKAGESLEELYKLQPSPGLAREILSVYRKADNLDKQIEWGETLFKMPEFDSDYMLRYGYVAQYLRRNDLQKAAEYAQLTLKSTERAKPKDAKEEEQIRQIDRACHHVIGSELFEKGNYADAITAFREAIKDEKYAQGYYMIGQSLDKEKDIEQAAHYYAMAELMGGDDAAKAKARLEVLYKVLHNDTLIGIDKVYNRAKESLAESDNKS